MTASTPFHDPLDALVFNILAYRTAAVKARTAFDDLRRRYPRWSSVNAAPTAEVEEIIRATGFAHQRAVLLQRLIEKAHRDFPDGSLAPLRQWSDDEVESYLTSLPGVGTFSAQQVMLYSLDRPVFPIARPITRMLTRLGISRDPTTVEQVLSLAARSLSGAWRQQLYDSLLQHSQVVCTPRFPRCRRCHLTDMCSYYRRNW